MSEALRLADKLELEWHNNALNYDTAIDSSIELRRLAPMEAELQQAREELAAIRASLSEPVFWFRSVDHGAMYEGLVHHNSVGGRMLREEKPGEWVPLFAIKAPQPAPPRKPLFEDLIAQHPGLREELSAMDAQPDWTEQTR
jgi:hypothetical protein